MVEIYNDIKMIRYIVSGHCIHIYIYIYQEHTVYETKIEAYNNKVIEMNYNNKFNIRCDFRN